MVELWGIRQGLENIVFEDWERIWENLRELKVRRLKQK